MKKLLVMISLGMVPSTHTADVVYAVADIVCPNNSHNVFSKFYLPCGMGVTTGLLTTGVVAYFLTKSNTYSLKEAKTMVDKAAVITANTGITVASLAAGATAGIWVGCIATFGTSILCDPTGALFHVLNNAFNSNDSRCPFCK